MPSCHWKTLCNSSGISIPRSIISWRSLCYSGCGKAEMLHIATGKFSQDSETCFLSLRQNWSEPCRNFSYIMSSLRTKTMLLKDNPVPEKNPLPLLRKKFYKAQKALANESLLDLLATISCALSSPWAEFEARWPNVNCRKKIQIQIKFIACGHWSLQFIQQI